MSTTTAWRRLERCILDGEPFVIEILPLEGGYRVRIRFEGRDPIDDDQQVWRTLDEVVGRGYQMADEAVERTLR